MMTMRPRGDYLRGRLRPATGARERTTVPKIRPERAARGF